MLLQKKRIWAEKVLWARSFTVWTLHNHLQLVNYPEYYNLIFCLGRFLILNQSPPKGKLISLWKSVSFKGNFFDHYENVPIHKLGWPSVKLCRRQPRWKKRSSAIMNTKIFWINIKQAIFENISNQFWIKVANSFSVQKNDAAFVLDPNPLAHNVTEEESVFLASMLE